MGAVGKYTLDTNLFVRAFREDRANTELIQFHSAFAPFEYLHSVVIQELRAGARTGRPLRTLEKHILDPFIRRGRIITPSPSAWKQSGDILRDLARKDGLELRKVQKSFGNDILLAASCREAGVIIVTDNLSDFKRIRRVFQFDFEPPWPVRT